MRAFAIAFTAFAAANVSLGVDYRPETWFHFIGGNVAKAGLDADLDAIQAAGIGGIQLFHGQYGKDSAWPGVERQIPCLSADWDELIRYAAEGCEKRGLVFKMQNCPGWSMSGGPWITQELAMRNLTYSRMDVEDGAAVELPVPDWQLESKLSPADLDYHDLFVLAFPTPEGDSPEPLQPELLGQVDVNGAMTKRYRFDHATVVRTITLPSPRQMNHDYSYRPEASVRLIAINGTERRTVLKTEIPQGVWQDTVPLTFACDEFPAYDYEFTMVHKHPMAVPEVKFGSGARLDNWEGLAGWVLRGFVKRKAARQDERAYVKSAAILDLTDRFHEGKLDWTPPKGERWTVLRIGHVNNGTRNAPAPKEATGWECNKMDRRAIDAHFAAYIGRLARGPLAGGKLKGFVVDSWECRRQTWTASLEADFRAANGYDFRKKLPAVFGWVLDEPQTTERFLLDWRRTLGELIEKNYYQRMTELARSHGMTAQYESAFGDVLPGDILRFWKWSDEPMCEFWHPRADGSVGQDDFKPIYPCASATHIYGKKRCSAESFTTMRLKWNESPADLKRTGNHAMARGVTHFVFHTYTHNPRTDWLPPGTSFGCNIGSAFIRGQTWWHAMKDFTDYFARCGMMLESGKPCSDVLWFLGDEVGHKPSEISPLPDGFRYDYCNQDALITRVSAKGGRLVLPDGVSYSVLWIPEGTYVDAKSEAKLRELAAAGAKIVRGTPSAAVAGLEPDLVVAPSERRPKISPIEPDIDWIHRADKYRDWYFVSANGATGYRGIIDFRATGTVELWDPVVGRSCSAKVVGATGGRTCLEFDLACGESYFVIFHRNAADATRISPRCDGTGASHQLSKWELAFPANWGAPESLALKDLRSWTELPMSDEARHFSGTAVYTAKFEGFEGKAMLDLGRVETVATVYVNGKRVRLLWAPPYRCEIPLKEGTNELRVEVANTWFNRLAYDAGLPEAERKTWTIMPPPKDSTPIPSGLIGPVKVEVFLHRGTETQRHRDE